MTSYDIDELRGRIGAEIYISEWTSVSQREIDEFARVTRDHDPMHIDPEFARTHGPFGTTVLFGFQILSMLSYLCRPLRFNYGTESIGYDLNYGFNRVRFVAPIPVNARFRNRVVLKQIERRKEGGYLVTTINTIEVEGGTRPAMVAEWIGYASRQDLGGDLPAGS